MLPPPPPTAILLGVEPIEVDAVGDALAPTDGVTDGVGDAEREIDAVTDEELVAVEVRVEVEDKEAVEVRLRLRLREEVTDADIERVDVADWAQGAQRGLLESTNKLPMHAVPGGVTCHVVRPPPPLHE